MSLIKPVIVITTAGFMVWLGCAAPSHDIVHEPPAVAAAKAEVNLQSLMEQLAVPVIQALVHEKTIKRAGVFMFTARKADHGSSEIAKQLTDAFEQVALRETRVEWIERARFEELINEQEKESSTPHIDDSQKVPLGFLHAADAYVKGEYYISPVAVYDSGTVDVTVYATVAQTGKKLAVSTVKIRLNEFPREAVRDEQNIIPHPRREDYDLIKRQ